ncbi:hypothetical protein PUNSTDRAFT_53324 [Punctularia strigosozonata HHB-11173 SS5]|uniref:uncharacterized protein n=1 Tax=Punctularia strigosozonata (strain HHB-11173) TaxID=741275 RepID=UPI0004418050|nr:uncharacterized protein PUNSTDRAFT_53324 [Punctularia strigosozonata HHB-11173 SS5]EIN08024.1 hypothetical protein PUNSTDRAFT_53324 [Punctularia strigosozonata HHB-11173 SS5]
MQLASTGARLVQGHASRLLGRGSNARNIHIPPLRQPPTPQNVVNKTRTLLTRFVGHLTAPATGAFARPPPCSGVQIGRGFSGAARPRTIQQGFSLPMRHALHKPMYMPRAPTVAVPRSVAQVGLGAARNFSSARPIFQNLIQNVPVAGRAICELDLDERMRMEGKRASVVGKEGKENAIRLGMLKEELLMKKVAKKAEVNVDDEMKKDLEHYFSEQGTTQNDVATYLLIPLAPTPTARMPLPQDVPPSSSGRLLPPSIMNILGGVHAAHSQYAAKVSSLFARLDAAHVWDRGASTQVYGDATGMCTVLKVCFQGWTREEVRAVIGEAGTGWCALEEVRDDEEVDSVVDDDALSDVESQAPLPPPVAMDPAQSFVLPTLDFSSSHLDARSSAATTPFDEIFPAYSRASSTPRRSNTDLHDVAAPSDWSDVHTDAGSEDDGSLADYLSDSDGFSDIGHGSRASSGGLESWSRVSFSGDFQRRLGAERSAYLF